MYAMAAVLSMRTSTCSPRKCLLRWFKARCTAGNSRQLMSVDVWIPVALLSSDACELAPLRTVLFLPFFYFFTSLFVSSAMIMYDRRTLLDIGQRYTNLIQDTLSTDSAWPLAILRNNELNNDHLNNRRRRKKHRGRRAGIRNRLRKRAHSPPLPSILLANVQSLENKMDDLRARISFQLDIRDCNILCLTKTWLTPTVPDTAVTPSDNFSVLRMDRTAEAGKTKSGGVCFMINRKWCDPRNISILSRSCSPHLHISPLSAAHSICPGNFHQSSLLLSTFHHNLTLAWLCSISTMCLADISTNILTLPSSSPETLTKPTSRRSCRTFISIYPVQPEDWIHSIIATLRSKMPTKPTHCRLLANQIMPPFSSHRNTKKGSLMNRRWRGKWRAGPPTLKLCYRRLLMTSTGTCSGRVHLTSANSRM